MAMNGTAMMLKSLGIDPDQIQRNVEEFMTAVKGALEKVDANQARIETKLDAIQARLDAGAGSTTHIHANGKPAGVLVTDEKFPQEMLDEAGMNGG